MTKHIDRVQVTHAAEQTWAGSPEIRAEFNNNKGAFIAYRVAVANGRVRESTHRGQVITYSNAPSLQASPARSPEAIRAEVVAADDAYRAVLRVHRRGPVHDAALARWEAAKQAAQAAGVPV